VVLWMVIRARERAGNVLLSMAESMTIEPLYMGLAVIS
jgi:hypothetical protein